MFRTICVALKFSPSGLGALEAAAELARLLKSRLVVVHALDYHLKPLPEDAPERTRAAREAEALYHSTAEPLLAGLSNVELTMVPADPGLELCRLAREHDADLLVVGCHQQHGSCPARIDYTGMTIMEKSPCPVLLVPLGTPVSRTPKPAAV